MYVCIYMCVVFWNVSVLLADRVGYSTVLASSYSHSFIRKPHSPPLHFTSLYSHIFLYNFHLGFSNLSNYSLNFLLSFNLSSLFTYSPSVSNYFSNLLFFFYNVSYFYIIFITYFKILLLLQFYFQKLKFLYSFKNTMMNIEH